jgi:hypothetical protein
MQAAIRAGRQWLAPGDVAFALISLAEQKALADQPTRRWPIASRTQQFAPGSVKFVCTQGSSQRVRVHAPLSKLQKVQK